LQKLAVEILQMLSSIANKYPGEVPVRMWYASMSLGIGSCCETV